jgi:hypothetical protein
MPQASAELNKEWDGPSDKKAIKYLTAAGYILTREYQWKKPTPEHVPTDKEKSAIWFLIDEWDFGGYIDV